MFFLALAKYYINNILYIISFILSSWLLFMYYENRFFNLWYYKYKSTKLLFSFFSLSLILYLSVNADSQLNDIFGVNSNVFTYTQPIVTGIYFLSIISGSILIIGVFSLFIFIYELFFPSSNTSLEFKQRGILVINGIILLFSFMGFAYPYMEEGKKSKLIESIALKVDFGNHLCSNIETERKVIYLNPSHSKVLIKIKSNSYEIFNCNNL